MNLVDDSLFNGDSVQTMKKGEARTVPGFHLTYWLIGDYNDQDNPYYVCDESDGSSCFISCGKDSLLGTVSSQIKELQKTKGVKEIIFPEVEYGPEVRVNIKDYPKTVTFTRNFLNERIRRVLMQYKRGNVLFSYKDSFDNSVLSKLIHDWLVNFKQVLVKRDESGEGSLGVPLAVLPVKEDSNFGEKDLEKGLSLWLEELDEMIFSFSDYEPEYTKGFVEGDYFLEPTDSVEWDRYKDDCVLVEKRKEAGRRLFIERYESLWW